MGKFIFPIDTPSIVKEMKSGKIYVHGYDKQNRPLIVIDTYKKWLLEKDTD